MTATLITAATGATATAVAAAFPYLGLGAAAKDLLDGAAADAITEILTTAQQHGLEPVAVAGCEGLRDGAPVVTLPRPSTASIHLYCDPVDGTLNAARGGPRAFSVVALTRALPQRGYLHDAQSIFGIGSQSWDVSAVFDPDGGFRCDVIGEHLHTPELMTATLNRDDNRALLYELSPRTARQMTIGSRSGHRPTIAAPGLIAVGDASITLPIECDLEFGRIGLLEAQIQSALYRSWSGLVVSRDRIRAHPDGVTGYLDTYLRARSWGDVSTLRALFTESELARFDTAMVGIDEVTAPLHPGNFGVGPDAVIAISALSSLHDRAVEFSPNVLHDPVWHGGHLDVDTIVVADATITRQVVSLDPAQSSALPAEVRQWYRTLHWSEVPGVTPALLALAEGRNPHAHNLIAR